MKRLPTTTVRNMESTSHWTCAKCQRGTVRRFLLEMERNSAQQVDFRTAAAKIKQILPQTKGITRQTTR
jgi:hypothetical protein